ncbi:MAG: ABC transporter permease [Bacteroidales bacterium]|nr:ABC transporter permease [Bacteroidales bacterium]
MILSVSWKNIWRNKLRSSIIITATALGLFGGIFGSAIINGSSERRVHDAIACEVGHVQLHDSMFLNNKESKYTIEQYESVTAAIDEDTRVKAWASRVKVMAMAQTANGVAGVMLNGVDAEKEKLVSDVHKTIKAGGGSFFGADGSKPIVIGEKLAKTLKLVYYQINEDDLTTIKNNRRFKRTGANIDSLAGIRYRNEGDFTEALQAAISKPALDKLEHFLKQTAIKYSLRKKIVVSFQTPSGHMAQDAYRLAGVYNTQNSMFDQANAFVLKEDLQAVMGFGNHQVNEIAILLNKTQDSDSVKATLAPKIPASVQTDTWKELMPDVGMLNDYMGFYMFIVLGIILLALGFGIVNTMLMAILDRVKELGMLMAIGMNRARVFAMIMTETILLCLTGGVAGMLLSYGLIVATANNGIDLTAAYGQGFEAMGFSAHLYPSIGLADFAYVTLLVVLTGILACIYPARKALKLKPAEALRTA